ncbi:MAG: hypothetical protein AAFS10_27950, partial [Myxococcota bacterium]
MASPLLGLPRPPSEAAMQPRHQQWWWGAWVVVLLELLALGCAPSIARDMARPIDRGPAGLIGHAPMDGPELWTGAWHIKAVDATGDRALVPDGLRLGVWRVGAGRWERMVPSWGHPIFS